MGHPWKKAVLCAGLGVLGSLSGNIAIAEKVPSPKAFLRDVADVYLAIRTFQCQTTSRRVAHRQGMEQTVRGEFSLILERPNKLSVIPSEKLRRIHLVCDGSQLYLFDPSTHQYTSTDAPANLGLLLQRVAPLYAQTGGGPLALFSFFADDPYEEMLKDVKDVKMIGEEEWEGVPTYHLLFHQETEGVSFNAHIWVDKARKLLLRSRFELEPPPSQEAQAETVVFEEEHRDIRIGQASPPAAFNFTPPEGATEAVPRDAALNWTGKAAPLFTLPAQGVESLSLESYKGKVVLLDFWASWCPPCRKELPILQGIYEEYREKGVVVIGVNCDQEIDKGVELVKEYGLSFPVVYDSNGEVSKRYKVASLPTLFVLDKTGKVQKVHIGISEGMEQVLKEEIRFLLQDKPLLESLPAKK